MFGKLNPAIIVTVVLVFVVFLMYQRMKLLAYRLDDLEQEVTDLHNEHAFCVPPSSSTGHTSGNACPAGGKPCALTPSLSSKLPLVMLADEDTDEDAADSEHVKASQQLTIFEVLSNSGSVAALKTDAQSSGVAIVEPFEATSGVAEATKEQQLVSHVLKLAFTQAEALAEAAFLVDGAPLAPNPDLSSDCQPEPQPEPQQEPQQEQEALEAPVAPPPVAATRGSRSRRAAPATSAQAQGDASDIVQVVQKIKAAKRISKRAAAAVPTVPPLCAPSVVTLMA